MPWDPNRYVHFIEERYAPFDDLVKLVRVREGLRVVDLGCGIGELTRRLADALPGSDVLGIDSSPQMLVSAAKQARAGLRFEQRMVEDLSGEWDLIFSNAAIHWVADHPSLIPRLLACLRAGGQLVVQMPSNWQHPTRTIIDDVLAEEPFRAAFAGHGKNWTAETIDIYAQLLYDNAGADVTVFEKIYPHVLEDADAMADWMSGTALVPYMERLPVEQHESFMARYRERLRKRFPSKPVFFGFRRILVAASKA